MTNHIEGKLKKKLFKTLISITFIFFSIPSIALELIRDPIFENYFDFLSEKNNTNINVYLVKDVMPNAFVIGNSIYFTTELLKLVEDEDTLKSIYYHELGHIINNHFESKKIKIKKKKDNLI